MDKSVKSDGVVPCGEYSIRYKVKDEYWMDWAIITNGGSESADYFKGDELSDGFTKDVDEAHAVCTGFIKWDGCQQIYFPDSSGPTLHFDEVEDVAGFMTALIVVRQLGDKVLSASEIDWELNQTPPSCAT